MDHIFSFCAIGVYADKVGIEAAEMLLRNIRHNGCVDEFLQDQVIKTSMMSSLKYFHRHTAADFCSCSCVSQVLSIKDQANHTILYIAPTFSLHNVLSHHQDY